MKRFSPWWVKILAKMILSRMPLRYSYFAKIGLFRHGQMDTPKYALQVFQKHFDRSAFSNKENGFVALELGPGDSFISAIIAHAYGATKCYMVDANNYAVDDISIYQRSIKHLQSTGIDIQVSDNCTTTDKLLEEIGGIYLTNGLQSLRTIPDNSVDFIWSQAVLEHIRLEEFDETMHELWRILHPTGVASHRIDLKDHLGGALNNLRFPTKVWESDLFAKSGFYTNRIQITDMINRFRHANFDINIITKDHWKHLPTPREKLSHDFSQLSDEELCISGFDVILRPINDEPIS